MKYRFVHGKDYFDDDNDGLLFGIESDEDFPEYTEWFSSEDEREKYADENDMKIIGGSDAKKEKEGKGKY